MSDQKQSNPKDIIGSDKAPMHLVPAIGIAETSLAHLEGHLKYGAWNWRSAGVRYSIYLDAALRHLEKAINGEDRDPKTGVHHLGSVEACINIILDASIHGKLTDDRPIGGDKVSEAIDNLQQRVKHLREIFKDCDPHHHVRCNGDPDEDLVEDEIEVIPPPPAEDKFDSASVAYKYKQVINGHMIQWTGVARGYIDGKFLAGTNFTSLVELYARGYHNPDEEVEALCAQERGE